MNTTFTLHRFYHDCNRVLCTCILDRLQVIVRSIRETICHRTKTNLASVTGLSCGRHRTKGTSVKTIFGSHDMIFIRTILLNTIFTCHLNHCLICLSSGVLKEDLVHSDRGAYLLCKQSLRNCVRIVKGMHNILYLINYGCHNFFVTVTCRIYRNSSVKIKVFLAFFIIHVLIPGRLTQKIHSLICLDHVRIYFVFNVLYS